MRIPDQHIALSKLLIQLRTGDLSADDWTKLDSLASNDPMLSDAIEGLKQTPAETRTIHIQNILSRIEAKKKRSFSFRVIPTWARVAASAVLVVGIAWLIMQTIDDTDPGQIAESVVVYEDSEIPTDQVESDLAHSGAHEPTAMSPASAQTQSSSSRSEPLAKSTEPLSQQPMVEHPTETSSAPSPDKEVTMSRARIEEDSDHRDVTDEAGMPSSDREVDAMKALRSDLADVIVPEVRGVVMNAVGERLIGAQIQIKGTQAETETDYLGSFALAIPNQNYRNALVISHKDYPAIETEVADGDSIIVRLQESMPAGSPAITTLSQKRMASAHKMDSRSLSQPSTGDRNFQKYVRLNLRYPQTAAQANIHGIVTIEFIVSSNGEPVNFRVIQSLGYGCDEEAIRLIREGPKWTNSESSIGRCEIQF